MDADTSVYFGELTTVESKKIGALAAAIDEDDTLDFSLHLSPESLRAPLWQQQGRLKLKSPLGMTVLSQHNLKARPSDSPSTPCSTANDSIIGLYAYTDEESELHTSLVDSAPKEGEASLHIAAEPERDSAGPSAGSHRGQQASTSQVDVQSSVSSHLHGDAHEASNAERASSSESFVTHGDEGRIIIQKAFDVAQSPSREGFNLSTRVGVPACRENPSPFHPETPNSTILEDKIANRRHMPHAGISRRTISEKSPNTLKIMKASNKAKPTITRNAFPSPSTVMRAAERLFASGCDPMSSVDTAPTPSNGIQKEAEISQSKSVTINALAWASSPPVKSGLPNNTASKPLNKGPRTLPASKLVPPRSRLERSTLSNKTEAPKPSNKAAAPIMALHKQQPQNKQKIAKALTQTQLIALTNQNTARNRAHYNKHEIVVVRKDMPRPPSPSEKLRRVIPNDRNAESLPKQGPRKESRKERAQKREALRSSLSMDAVDSFNLGTSTAATGSSVSSAHFLAPGDEEGGYRSPLKRMRSSQDSHPRKMVKWDRTLVDEVVTDSLPFSRALKASKSTHAIMKRNVILDSHGNVANAKQPLSPIVPRTDVKIMKLVYEDDEEDV